MVDIRGEIGLTRDEFKGSLSRILSFYGIPKTQEEAAQAAGYLNSLFEVVQSWPKEDFEEVCQRLVTRISPIKKPMPREFIFWRDFLISSKPSKSNLCDKCNGIGMVYVRVFHEVIKESFPACKPCPKCRPRGWKPKIELKILEDQEPYKIGEVFCKETSKIEIPSQNPFKGSLSTKS